MESASRYGQVVKCLWNIFGLEILQWKWSQSKEEMEM
jgi:hypothetical protein